MFRNHLKVIFRKLRKEKLYSFVNIFGLTIGLMTVLLIALYVKDELSFDQFHTDKDRIYRLIIDHERFGYRAWVASDYVELISPDIPQLTAFSRLSAASSASLLQYKEHQMNATGVHYTDANFFEFFDFKLKNALSPGGFFADDQAIISAELKQKLFGDDEAIGAEILINKVEKFTVVAVADKVPKNSTIQFNVLLHKRGYFKNDIKRPGYKNCITYVSIQPGYSLFNLTDQINEAKDKPSYRKPLQESTFELMPLTEQRLKAPYGHDAFAKNSMSYVVLFSGIGFVILLLALINYVNLVTAQSINRMKEIGLRKVIGANRRQLMYYQLLESVVLTTISFLLAFALAERILPVFNELLDKDIALSFLSMDFLLWVVGAGMVIGVCSGLYPAFFIARYKTLSLITKSTSELRGKGWFRKSLVLFQFSASAILIIILVVMMGQMNYLKNKDLGYNPEMLVTVPLYSDSTHLYGTVKNEISTISGVKSVSVNGFSPGREVTTAIKLALSEDGKKAEGMGIEAIYADSDFLNTLGIKSVWKATGFDFKDFGEGQVMVNQAMADDMGWTDGARGKKLYSYNEKQEYDVVAILTDFHAKSLKEEISPLIIKPLEGWGTDQIFVRLETEQSMKALKEIGEVYTALMDRPFEYSFFDDMMATFYKKETGQYRLFQVFSALAVFISLLGLLALTVYMVEQRRKEVSIRKVLGASLKGLIIMLNKEYTLLVLIAFLIASPVAYYAMQSWLEGFKYRIEVSPLLFAGAFMVFLCMSWCITVLQSWRVSGENPADVLRQE